MFSDLHLGIRYTCVLNRVSWSIIFLLFLSISLKASMQFILINQVDIFCYLFDVKNKPHINYYLNIIVFSLVGDLLVSALSYFFFRTSRMFRLRQKRDTSFVFFVPISKCKQTNHFIYKTFFLLFQKKKSLKCDQKVPGRYGRTDAEVLASFLVYFTNNNNNKNT